MRRRISMFREHEYAVLLFSLGGLGAPLPSFAPAVRAKVHHRAARVCGHLTSRSVSNALLGLGRCGETWEGLGDEGRRAWCDALCPEPSPDSDEHQHQQQQQQQQLQQEQEQQQEQPEGAGFIAAGAGAGAGAGGPPRGLLGMNRAEVQQVVLGLRALGAGSQQLPGRVSRALAEAAERTGCAVAL